MENMDYNKMENMETQSNDSSLGELTSKWLDSLEEKEMEELEENVMELMEEYVYGNIVKMSDPKFSSILCDDLTVYFFGLWCVEEICMDTDEDYKEINQFIIDTYPKYLETFCILPPRQCAIDSDCISVHVGDSLERIESIYQPKQRTMEWYEKRYNMLTASNISKALGSEAQRNSLIYEKCKPLTMDHQYGNVNVENSMHWGVKYEPVSVSIYEHMFSAKIADFGCIPHQTYPFIGASPDGIVCDPMHPRYGHMVEIKNIVNRDITGIPKEEYWIQMQVQLETCDLEYCDFVETRIKEYENHEQYYSDNEHKYKGVVLYFVKKMLVAGALPLFGTEDGRLNIPHYEYMPLDIPITQTGKWIQDKKAELQEEYVLYKIDYWYLDAISCVLVQRNREWFNVAVPKFIDIWETIEIERVSGYAHRAPVKKTKKIAIEDVKPEQNETTIKNIQKIAEGKGVCLIKLDEAGNNVNQKSSNKVEQLHDVLLL